MRKSTSKLGIKIIKLVGAVTILSMLMLLGASKLLFNNMFNDIREEVNDYIVKSIEVIDGDKLGKVVANKDMNSKEYIEIRDNMDRWKSDKEIKYFYTIGKGKEDKGIYLVDTAEINLEEPGSELTLDDEMKAALNGNISVTKDTISYGDESVISAFAPIKDSSGNIVGIVGMDRNVDTYLYMKKAITVCIIVVLTISIVISLIIGAIFSKRIMKNVDEIEDALNIMGQGNLNINLNIKSNDEFENIGRSINDVRFKISNIVKSIKDNSYSVEEQSKGLYIISKDMATSLETSTISIQGVSEGSNFQASELLRINDSLKEFGIKIETTTEEVKNIHTLMEEVNIKAINSSNDLEELDDSVRDISISFEDMKDKIQDLDRNVSEISEITNLINSISDQTNLLALNASIEAARAGESGKGFAVVAEEIRKLAEQSKESSINITNVIKSILNETEEVINTSEITKNKLNNQIGVLDKSMDNFRYIINGIECVIPKVNEINTNIISIDKDKEEVLNSIYNITSVAQEVSSSIEEITSITEELTASSQEVSSSAQILNIKSEEMGETVEQFKTN